VPTVRILRSLVLGLAALGVCASAQADIKSFNAAMKAGDFKTAAAEAASTWSTLDKSRDDLPIIAREFGFAAYMAEDFAAAAMFATEALREGGDTPEVAASRTQSTVLLRAAEHRTKPTDASRNALVVELQARAALPGLDAITFLAARDALNYDVGKGRWSAALESSAVAKTLAEAGGPDYRVSALRFEMWQAAAFHAASKDSAANDRLVALRNHVISDIDAAASDAAARMHVALYWEVEAWEAATAPRVSRFNRTDAPAEKDPSLRSSRLLANNPNPACKFKPDFKQIPAVPEYASDNKFNGVIVMKVDVDEKGVMSNATSLASAPDPALGPGLVEFLVKTRNNRFRQDGEWGPSCTLARKGYIFTWIFQPAR
jgi:hypothetical protein